MANDLSVAFERLRTSTQRLNTICDAAAQAVRDTEVYLEELRVGVTASVPVITIRHDEEGLERTEIFLGYFRPEGQKFRIAVSFASYQDGSFLGSDAKTWAECSRDDKLLTFEKLPELIVEIAGKVDERVSKSEQTIADVTAQLPLPKKKKGGEK